MAKGFPKEVGGWNVTASVPATRTSGASGADYPVIMLPQGTRKPDYGKVTVLPTDVEAVEVGFYIDKSNDAEKLWDMLNSWEYRYSPISACLVDSVDYDGSDIDTRCFGCRMYDYYSENLEDLDAWQIYLSLPGNGFHFKYSGKILFYLPPVPDSETGEPNLKSTTVTVSGDWDFYTQPVE